VEPIACLTRAAAPDPLSALAAPPPLATLVELRADHFPGLELRRAVAACPQPLLVTLRSTAEGGEGPTDPEERRAILTAARDAGAALVDLELERDLPLIDRLGLEPQRVIVSWHDPHRTSADLAQRAEALLATPARWVKAVSTAGSLADLEAVLALHRRFNAARRDRRRLIAFAMGLVGIPSRYLAPLLGPSLVYAAWSREAAAAPGQLTAEQLHAVVGHLQGPPRHLYGVVGGDTSRSLSPAMHAAAHRALGQPDTLLPFSVPDPSELAELFVPRGQGLLARVGLNAHGLAVTSPHKAAAAAAATLCAPRVRTADAANTLVLKGDRVLAENTDADGVVGCLLQLGVEIAGRRALVQGTGGAGRGAAVGLHLAGAEVILRGRDVDRTHRTADLLGVAWCAPDVFPDGVEVLVNATPLGTGEEDPSPFRPEAVRSASAVVDMTYADHPSALARLASSLRVPLADGREFLFQQGRAQLAAFLGRLPPTEAMRAAVREHSPPAQRAR
jgi:shikimate dehydrogenase/3-dehydroquinate dehydratase type I